jgi:class 3 adenylate cyclase
VWMLASYTRQMAASRRTVTVLFCDVVDWTRLGSALDPEALRERQTRYHGAARLVLERHGGTVEKFIGDAVMAVFGWPVVREDDALRAVRAASELRAGVSGFQVRVGINTGEVAAGEGDAVVTGDAVNLAKRLEQAADAGTVLIGDGTRALVAGAVELAPVNPLQLKGKDEPVAAWRLVDIIGDAQLYARRLDVPFVGRVADLGRLAEELERSRDGCRMVTVVGPAGIGKSRLAFEFVESVRGTATVLTGRCLPYGDGITFWPLAEALREAGREEVLADVAGEELFWRVRRVFEELAVARPLVLVFEDIHWAEPTFLDLLEYLAGWSDAPLLLVCLARPELYERRSDWPREPTIALAPLASDESERLVAALASGLDPEIRRQIGDVAGGNPLFVEQLSASAAEGELAVPPSIQALLAARLDRLTAEERSAVERAAVIGREFTAAQVSELDGSQRRSTLLALVRKELVRPAGGDDGFAFRHILIRDAAYEAIPKRVRAELHERVAAFAETDELVGYHLEQAYRYGAELGEPDVELAGRAGAALAIAGSRAFDRSDMPAAINLLERALVLATPDDPARPELTRRLAVSLWATGEVERSHSTLDAAIHVARERGDRHVEWVARLDASARQTPALDNVRRDTAEAIAAFEELEDDAGLAHAWRRLAVAALTSCAFGEAQQAAEQALGYARRSGERHQIGRTVDHLCTALLYGPTPADTAAARCRELLAEADGDRLVEANALSSLVGLEAMLGNAAGSRRHAQRAHEIFDLLGARLLQAGLCEVEAQAELLSGDPEAAERACRRGDEILRGAGQPSLAGTVEGLLAEAVLLQGRPDEAERLAARAADVLDEGVVAARVQLLCVQARLLAARGEADSAESSARAAIDLAAGTDATNLQGDAFATLASVTGDEASAAAALTRYVAKRNLAAAARLASRATAS